MVRYYCSGFDTENAFGHGLAKMFKNELRSTDSVVYVPGDPEKIEKVRNKYVPIFREHFKREQIIFKNETIISKDMQPKIAQEKVKNASFIMLMGGDPLKQKNLCESLGLLDILKNYDGVMLGVSAGAMLMSKYIIIIPCSDEYPKFHIEDGLNLDNISIYPHINTSLDEYPNMLKVGDETYKKDDLMNVAREYGQYYLLQDNMHENGKTDVSIIKSINGILEVYKEEQGRIWLAKSNAIEKIRNGLT